MWQFGLWRHTLSADGVQLQGLAFLVHMYNNGESSCWVKGLGDKCRPQGMNCILGDGGSACKYMRHQISLTVLRRDGSRQDVAGLDGMPANLVCILIIHQTLSLFAYIRECSKGPCCC